MAFVSKRSLLFTCKSFIFFSYLIEVARTLNSILNRHEDHDAFSSWRKSSVFFMSMSYAEDSPFHFPIYWRFLLGMSARSCQMFLFIYWDHCVIFHCLLRGWVTATDIYIFWYRVLLCSTDCLGTHYVDQADLILTEIHLPVFPKS